SYGSRYDPQIRSELLVLEHSLPVLEQEEEIHIEVYAEEDHEHSDHTVDVCAVVIAHAGVPVGKSSGPGCTERMHERVIQVHSSQHEEDYFHGSEHKIHRIKDRCRISRLGNKLICLRSRHFCSHQRHRIVVVKRRDHQDEHEHSHTANKVFQSSTEINAQRKRFDILENSRACSREA